MRAAIAAAAEILADAGIDSATADAEQLAVHLTGIDRGRLRFLDEPDAPLAAR